MSALLSYRRFPVSVLTADELDRLQHAAYVQPPADIAVYLQDQLGQRIAAHLVGLGDTRQLGRYLRPDGPQPSALTERRMREAFVVVSLIAGAYDAKTARSWLFGTNTRLDDRAPIEVLGAATETTEFAAVVRAARQFATFQ